jgi:hypothetical protein
MDNILVTNVILEDKISISFNLQDGTIPFPPFDLSTAGDIELNPLIIKLTEFLELNRLIEINYSDTLTLLEADSKIILIKSTLDDIYNSFNLNIIVEEDEEDEEDVDSDLL